MILLDTSALIELAKESLAGVKIAKYCKNERISISTITINEILLIANKEEEVVFKEIFEKVSVLPFDEECAHKSVEIERALKKKGMLIGKPDIFVGAVALANNISVVTSDKDFKRIKGLRVIFVEN
jgi:tRNA(fMet)-specific endonuclease VapC